MNRASHGKWNLMQKNAMYQKWEKKCNEIVMDVLVRGKYYINSKRRERFGSGNTGETNKQNIR